MQNARDPLARAGKPSTVLLASVYALHGCPVKSLAQVCE
jgi:hypothetical protein